MLQQLLHDFFFSNFQREEINNFISLAHEILRLQGLVIKEGCYMINIYCANTLLL